MHEGGVGFDDHLLLQKAPRDHVITGSGKFEVVHEVF